MASSTQQDGWDWPYILYAGRKLLGYTDEQTLALTPRQFDAQLRVHYEFTNGKKETQQDFIDNIPGW